MEGDQHELQIHQINHKIRESEERWKFALEGAGEGVWDWNPQTDEAVFSSLWKEMIGYAEHEFPNTGTGWVEHLHPDDKVRVLSTVQEYFSSRQPSYVVEFRLRCKDGSWKWILARGKLVSRDVDGNPLRMIGTHKDITERKLAEATLRESDNRQRLLEQQKLVQTSLDGFIVTRVKDARIIEANKAFCDMLGYSQEELLTMSVPDMEAFETNAVTANHIKNITDVRYVRFETSYRHKQGHLVNIEASISYSESRGGILFMFVRDITERKQTELNLRESESRFRTLFESATDCMLILDEDGRIIDINRTGYERLGYEKEEMLGRGVSEFDTPEFESQVPKRIAEIEKNGQATFESAHVRKDGTVMPVEISSKIINLDGKPRLFSVVRDISERKRTEQKVADLQYRNESILNVAGDGICGLDENGKINFINPAAARMLGYSTKELLGQLLDEICLPAGVDIQACPVADCKILISSNWENTVCRKGEGIYRRKNGDTFPVSYSRAPIIHKRKCTGCVVLFRDITERKLAEQSLRDSEEKFRAIVNQILSGVIHSDNSGYFTFANDRFCEITGYTREELLGKHWGSLTHPDDLPHNIKLVEQHLHEEKPFTFEKRYLRKNGETVWVNIGASILHGADGKVLGIASLVVDITNRKQLEKEMQERRNEMEYLQKLHVADLTATAIAHELNQPLLAIATYNNAALILMESAQIEYHEIYEAIEKSEWQAQRAGQKMRELLEFLRLKEFPSEAFDLNQEIRNCLKAAKSEFEFQFVPILHQEEGLPWVIANRTQVQKVLFNLLSNGIEAMQQSNVALPTITVSVCTKKDANVAQVSIQDVGPGVAQENFSRLFEPFFTTKSKGIGMGLAVSRSLIEANGGQLWIAPHEGAGATFHLTLPFAQ